MTKRIQVILDEEEHEAFRTMAKREGLSLSAWLRHAGRERIAGLRSRESMSSLEDLRRFFAACDAREEGMEPDWEQHQAVIERSARSGETGT